MKEELKKANRIIAEFISLRVDSHNGDTWCVGKIGDELWHNVDEPYWKFHSSWDWLIPVWKECKHIGIYMMTNGHDKLWLEKSEEIEGSIVKYMNHELAVKRISYMIQWYNEQIALINI